MRPGQLHPNEFETAVLKRFASDNPDANLPFGSLHVLERTFTGVGTYTKFLVKEWSKANPRRVITPKFAVTIPTLERGLDAVMFLEGDELVLELVASGEYWDGVFDGFVIDTAA